MDSFQEKGKWVSSHLGIFLLSGADVDSKASYQGILLAIDLLKKS